MIKIYLIFSSVLCISFAISYVAIKKQLHETQDLLAETFEANYLLTEQLVSSNKTDNENHNENFIKYLSDSRDWAFSYIENTQQLIKEISEELKQKGFLDISEKLNGLLPDGLDK
jgi:flagellar motility protein MotE (MotC chaperone)